MKQSAQKIQSILLEIEQLEAAGDYGAAADLLISIFPQLNNQPAAQIRLVSLLKQAGREQSTPEVLASLQENKSTAIRLLYPVFALLAPLLILVVYTAFFLISWTDFVAESGGIDALRAAYEQGKRRSGRPNAAFKRDQDQLAAEKILSEAFRKRFSKQTADREVYIMEDSYFDRYPDIYYPESRAKNFIRLTKNLSFFSVQNFEEMLPEFKKQIASAKDPLLRFRYYLEIAYNYLLFDDTKKSQPYLELALRQPVAASHLTDAWFLQASVNYQNKEYSKAARALANCREKVFFEAEMLSLFTDFQLIDRQNLGAYLKLDERLIKMIKHLDGDLYYLQSLYNEFEKIRRESTDPMAIFFGAEILYGMGNLKKAKTYFQEYKNSERRVNFSSFKKAAIEMDKKVIKN